MTSEDGGVLERIRIYQAVIRRWSWKLSLNDRALLLHLTDMTVGWGRTYIETTAKQLAEGRQNKTEWGIGPVGMSRASVERSLVSLREQDLIRTEKVQHPGTKAILGLRIWPNVARIIEPWEVEFMPGPVIREPKRLKNMHPHADGGVPSQGGKGALTEREGCPHSEGHNTNTYTSNLTGKNTIGRGDAAPGGGPSLPGMFNEEPEEEENKTSSDEKSSSVEKRESAVEAARRSMAKSTARRLTELEAARERIRSAVPWGKARTGDMIRGDDLWTVWHASYVEGLPYDDAPALWTKADRGAAMDMFKRWTVKRGGEKPNGEFDEFLIWAVTEWRSIMSDKFGWMTNNPPPKVPNIRFLCKWFPQFEEGFVMRGRKQVLSRLDLTEFDELRAKGFSEARAIEEIAKRKFAKAKAEGRSAAPTPKPLPVARQRSKPLQRVATESRLTPEVMQPTSVVRQQIGKKSASDWEQELWGDGESDGE